MNETPDLSHSNWVKSSYSNGQGGACVECATSLGGIVAVRDSKDPDGLALAFAAESWRAFTSHVKIGRMA
jgi:Domain of unknown function (DUF397)